MQLSLCGVESTAHAVNLPHTNYHPSWCLAVAAGWVVTWIFLPDSTGLSLDELDRMAKYMLAGEFQHYHGEGINSKHLSTWERYGWGSNL